MRVYRVAALVAGIALVLGGCTTTEPEPVQQEVVTPAPPAPPAPEPVQQEEPPPPPEPTDNCGLDPADMDQKTKVQCGLVEEVVPETTYPGGETSYQDWACDISPNGERVCEGDPPTFDEQCRAGILTAADGCSSADTPEDDGPGSMYTNPQYEQYQQDTGYPYPYEQYDELPGYQQCGTACGQDPTSGEVQREWGCQQGYITEGC